MAVKKKKEIVPRSIDIEFDGKIYPFRVWKDLIHDKESKSFIQVLCADGDSEMRGDLQMNIPISKHFGATTMERLKELILHGFANQRKDWERDLRAVTSPATPESSSQQE